MKHSSPKNRRRSVSKKRKSKKQKQAKCIIYGRLSCPYTVLAIKVAKNAKSNYKFIDIEGITSDHNKELVRRNYNSIPAIFIVSSTGSKFLGGYTELLNLYGKK